MKAHSTNSVRLGSIALAFGLVATASAFFGGPSASATSSVVLTPPPLDWYTCQTNGSGTVCHGKQGFSHTGDFDGTCPQGFDILENGSHQETGHRYYDRNGFLVKRVLNDVYLVNDPMNVLYNSVTGTSIPYHGHITESDSFGVPGDFGSVTATITGNLYSASLPGWGLLVHDVGTITFAPNGDILQDHGPKMVLNGDVAELCAALAQP